MERANRSSHNITKRVSHGTSHKELVKALDRYLNSTGAGDYEMPDLTGLK